GAAAQLLERKLPLARGGGESLDLILHFREGHFMRVAQNRYGKPAIRAYRDSEIDEIVIDDLLAVDRRIDPLKFLQRQRHGLGEKAHEAQTHPVFLFEHFLE